MNDDVDIFVGWFYSLDSPVMVPVVVGLHKESYDVVQTESGDLMEERLLGWGKT